MLAGNICPSPSSLFCAFVCKFGARIPPLLSVLHDSIFICIYSRRNILWWPLKVGGLASASNIGDLSGCTDLLIGRGARVAWWMTPTFWLSSDHGTLLMFQREKHVCVHMHFKPDRHINIKLSRRAGIHDKCVHLLLCVIVTLFFPSWWHKLQSGLTDAKGTVTITTKAQSSHEWTEEEMRWIDGWITSFFRNTETHWYCQPCFAPFIVAYDCFGQMSTSGWAAGTHRLNYHVAAGRAAPDVLKLCISKVHLWFRWAKSELQ